MTESLSNLPDNLNPFAICRQGLGCLAAGRCVAAPLRKGMDDFNTNARVEQGLLDLDEQITGTPTELNEDQILALEGQAELLDIQRQTLANCGLTLLRIESNPELS